MDTCWPGQSRIAFHTGMDVRSVGRAITELEEAGHITVDRSNGRHSKYLIHPKPTTESPGYQRQRVRGTPDNETRTPDTLSGDPSQAVVGPPSGCLPNKSLTRIETEEQQQPEAVVVDSFSSPKNENRKPEPLPAEFPITDELRAFAQEHAVARLEDKHVVFVEWARNANGAYDWHEKERNALLGWDWSRLPAGSTADVAWRQEETAGPPDPVAEIPNGWDSYGNDKGIEKMAHALGIFYKRHWSSSVDLKHACYEALRERRTRG